MLTLPLVMTGNRISAQQSAPGQSTQAAAYTYNQANQLNTGTVNGAAVSYGYNPNGDLTSIIQSGTSTANYGYDSADRLNSVTAQGKTTSYTYDGFNNRISQTANGLTTNYLVDPSGGLPHLLGEFPSGGSNPTYYLPGMG